jgi:hypothetical protein
VKWQGRIKCLEAEARHISLRGRIHLEVSERASEQRDSRHRGGLNGGRRHACAAGPGKQASTSTHTSHSHFILSILHADLSHHIQQGKQGCRMVLPRFPYMLHLDWPRVIFARYEDANATGGGAELVEGTVKSTPTCINRRHKTIVPDHGGF